MESKNILLLVLLSSCGIYIACALKCDRAPEASSANKSPPDGRYRLRIHNDPVRYIPGEMYNISLEGISRINQESHHKFTGFFITVEKDSYEPRSLTSRAEDDVGSFHIAAGSASAKFSEKCQNLVTHASSLPKSDVMVFWTAPVAGNGCVVFKSTVIEHRDVWFSDDGALSKVLCEDEAESGDQRQELLDVCTACNEAKYELTFEGLWSRHTHPKDFPDNGWLTKFSDVIGASHAKSVYFWKYGEVASNGLKGLAEHGSTGILEDELKQKGNGIRTIIKARGISYPNVTGKTFAVFRVDSMHHLVSLVSMIYPSPDWFVGVSELELCLPDGSWVEQKILNLYPYDAGTDSGPTYISSDQATIPPEAIRRIKPNQPNDPRSPFHNPDNKEMKPMARLYLTRQRLYDKTCDNTEASQASETAEVQEDVQETPTRRNNKCKTTSWSAWSKCSERCGEGVKTRDRSYVNPDNSEDCSENLQDSQPCHGKKCSGYTNAEPTTNDDENEEILDDKCTLTAWSPESECSKECGDGEITRTRRFKKNHNHCQKKYFHKELTQSTPCTGENCSGDLGNESPLHKDTSNCPVTDWSPPSECNSKCGSGEMISVRIPLEKQKREENLARVIRLYKKLKRRNNDEGDDEDDIDVNLMEISDVGHPCYGTELIQRERCEIKDEDCESDDNKPSFCFRPPKRQNCHGKPENRWYYKNDSTECGLFTYTGCNNELNNFESEEDCLSTCETKLPDNLSSHSHKGQIEKIDCKVSHWKHVPCNATCGEGISWKYMEVINRPQNGGRPCPRPMVRRERCYVDCEDSKATPASHRTSSVKPHRHHQCRYTDWSEWSPCSKSCGDFAVQIRTRAVLNHRNPHVCNERLEERRCEVMPCLVGTGYSYKYRS